MMIDDLLRLLLTSRALGVSTFKLLVYCILDQMVQFPTVSALLHWN